MKICPNCKTDVKDTAKFCFLCGNRFDAAPTPQPQSAAPETGIGEPSFPPPPKDFSLIGPFIHWNILPEQIAVKIDENDIAAYGRDVKGVSIQADGSRISYEEGVIRSKTWGRRNPVHRGSRKWNPHRKIRKRTKRQRKRNSSAVS